MGQMRPAIVLGIRMTKALYGKVVKRLMDEDGEWPGLAEAAPPRFLGDNGTRSTVLGYVVAVECDADSHPGAAALNPFVVPLTRENAARTIGRTRIAKAIAKWKALAQEASKRGVLLPPPDLIATTAETA